MVNENMECILCMASLEVCRINESQMLFFTQTFQHESSALKIASAKASSPSASLRSRKL